jgi:osmotically-inducible protein OsmY
MKTDLEIQNDVIDELKWETYLKASDIGVSVKNGIVTLSGMVDLYSKKRAAEQAAYRVDGVQAVAEDIIVKFGPTFKKTDSEIAEAVINAMKWHSIIPEDKIKIKVEDGWVTVTGDVEWTYEKNAVKYAIENLSGVKGINNMIAIKPKMNVNTATVKQKIEEAFRRNATIDSDNIFVENKGNKIVLKGIVRSYAEKNDAEHASWNAPGVTEVENKLEVVVPAIY